MGVCTCDPKKDKAGAEEEEGGRQGEPQVRGTAGVKVTGTK